MKDDEALTGQLRHAARVLQEPPLQPLPADFAARAVRQAFAPDPVTSSVGTISWVDWLRAWWQPRLVSPGLQFGWAIILCALTATLTLWGTGGFEQDERVYVRFAVDVPAAHSVALAGDFNNWDPGAARLQPAGTGRWEALVPLAPGVYQYMFVVDGREWIPDPAAAEQVDDGFGQRNSLMRIRPAVRKTPGDALDFL